MFSFFKNSFQKSFISKKLSSFKKFVPKISKCLKTMFISTYRESHKVWVQSGTQYTYIQTESPKKYESNLVHSMIIYRHRVPQSMSPIWYTVWLYTTRKSHKVWVQSGTQCNYIHTESPTKHESNLVHSVTK